MDVRTQLYITPNSQWNNEDSLWKPFCCVYSWTTLTQSNTTHVYL